MTPSKKDWEEEIKEKVFERFKEYFAKLTAGNFTYNHPLSIEDEFLIDTTISEVLKSVSEEMTSRIRECKQRLPKLRGNAWLKENGEIRAFEYVLEYLDRIFREKMGEKK